jgi:hypothetical protein
MENLLIEFPAGGRSGQKAGRKKAWQRKIRRGVYGGFANLMGGQLKVS